MHTADEWPDLVSEAHQAHPRFPRATLERLVTRTARELQAQANPHAHDMPTLIRDAVMRQLHYADQLLDGGAPAAAP